VVGIAVEKEYRVQRVDSEGFFLRGGGVSTAEDFWRLGRRGGGCWSAAGRLG